MDPLLRSMVSTYSRQSLMTGHAWQMLTAAWFSSERQTLGPSNEVSLGPPFGRLCAA